jgi:tRNA(Ile)-lysidine synthase
MHSASLCVPIEGTRRAPRTDGDDISLGCQSPLAAANFSAAPLLMEWAFARQLPVPFHRMHELSQKLLQTIRKQELLRPGDRVAAAVSGGADSVALLLLLDELRGELGIVLSVVHVNHKLRGAESDEDERFVAELAKARGLECHFANLPLTGTRSPSEAGPQLVAGLEAKARKLRYDFCRELARTARFNKIATGHTLDDQAETLLLRIFRGTGIRGLAGVHPRIALLEEGRAVGEIVRPLLGFRRPELRHYLQSHGQKWREDSSNENVAFLRNRVRQRLLPLIGAEFGDAAIEHMAELAEIARAEEEWAATNAAETRAPNLILEVEPLLALPLASARRLVRAWIETNAPEVSISFRLIEETLDLARGEAGKKIELPGVAACTDDDGNKADGRGDRPRTVRPKSVRRGRNELALEREASDADDYQYTLNVPGEIAIPELETRIEARIVKVESVPADERDGLIDPAHIGAKLIIRNWRAGDRYWPAHTGSDKKVKELLGDRHATGAQKKLWPVVVNEEGSLVWMRGFAVPAAWRAAGRKAICIQLTSPNPRPDTGHPVRVAPTFLNRAKRSR